MKKYYFTLVFFVFFYSQNFAQIVAIPDANFKTALLAHTPTIDTNSDNEIQVTEAVAFTGELNVYGKSISNLTGLEAFTEITKLDCRSNNIVTFVPSANTKITSVKFGSDGGTLTSVDLSANTLLTEIVGEDSFGLASISLTNNTNLEILKIESCNLSSLDVSTNIKIVDLDCDYNNNLSSLTLPAANNTLETLSIQSNKLIAVDIPKLLALKYIYARNTLITVLDFSAQTDLRQVFSGNNSKLTSVNLKNGHNNILTDIEFTNSPLLTTICVDNVSDATNHTDWTKDAATTYTTNCTLAINDVTFNNAIKVYPNPIQNGRLTIKNSSNQEISKIIIYNLLGKKVQKTNALIININNLEKGVYLVKLLTTSGNVAMKKILIN